MGMGDGQVFRAHGDGQVFMGTWGWAMGVRQVFADNGLLGKGGGAVGIVKRALATDLGNAS